ncbi:MAG: hypothetical protein GEU93_18155 [Propionibacteriales bacterium]|nr:hypothetical protein [Propionibacteriales bacterium]
MGISSVRETFRTIGKSIQLARELESGRLTIDDVRAAMTEEPLQAEAAASPEPNDDQQVAA